MTDFSDGLPSRGAPRLPPSTQTAPPASPPPHPLDSEWFIHLRGETYGPYSGHRLSEFLKEGRIDGATQVLAVGSENWQHAAEDRRLSSLFSKGRSQSAETTPPPISAAAGATVVQVTNQIAPQTLLLTEDGDFGPKSAGVALLLSFLLCGAGQMYCGRVGKGFLMLFGAIALWFILLGWIIQIWSMIDAYQTAKQMNLRFLRRLQAGAL